MAAILFTATAEHECHYRHCSKGQKITVGDRAIKTTSRQSNSGGSYTTTVYYHEDCYNSMKGGKGR